MKDIMKPRGHRPIIGTNEVIRNDLWCKNLRIDKEEEQEEEEDFLVIFYV